MKNRKKFLFLIFGILICLLIFCLIQIYAKYITSAEGNTNMSVARWNILVNNLSIKENSNISSSIIPIFPGNEHIAKDIIAPTAEGYFDLNFNFSDADVSFKYEITTSVAENSSVKDLVATGYSIDNGEKISFTDTIDSIEDTIYLSDNINTRKIRIFVKWDDDESTATMDNKADTTSTTSENPVLFNVNINFTQVID